MDGKPSLPRRAQRTGGEGSGAENPCRLSPLINHQHTQRGAVTGGFERKQYSELVEQALDNAFAYARPLVETFRYAHAMQHGIPEQCAALRM